MIKNNYVSLVMPCKNEARALKAVLKDLPEIIDEVIVVDNNSNDQTKKIARLFGAKVFTEYKNDRNGIGYGYAYQKGIQKAKGNIIVCMDGDGSYPIKEICSIINSLLKNHLDFISCNRLPFKDPKKMSLVRSFGVKVLNLMVWILYGYKIKDSLTGMWVFRHDAYDSLLPSQGGWNFSLEIKLRAIMHPGIKFAEKHITYHDRVLDLSKQNLFLTGLEHLFYLSSLKLALIRSNKLNLGYSKS